MIGKKFQPPRCRVFLNTRLQVCAGLCGVQIGQVASVQVPRHIVTHRAIGWRLACACMVSAADR